LRIALDATPLTLTSGGLARYTRELACALQAEFPDDELVLLSDQPFTAPPGLRAGAGPRNRIERLWWTLGLELELSRQNADLFHGTNFSVPYLARHPAVMSVHDLSPWMDPSWHHAAERVRRRTPVLIGLGLATMILTDTEAVRRQAIERWRLHPGRVAAAPLAASSVFHPVQAEPDARYFLFTGTLEPRKNVGALIEAWRSVRARRNVELWLAGRRRADFPELRSEPGLRLLGEVPDSELPRLYSGALAFVYPSAYEGFGLPVLEAMQCGACVIASRDAALLEVSGGAAIHADIPQLSTAMLTVIDQDGFRREMQARAAERAAAFSWTRTARLTRAVYEEACRRFHA
jgi:glycosyltransferase involved in cell wall biosynthesis